MAALTDKEKLMRQVIINRIDIIRNQVLPNITEKTLVEYYGGKIDGLVQAYELIGESIESLQIETK